jgi:predicted transcriptional regulator
MRKSTNYSGVFVLGLRKPEVSLLVRIASEFSWVKKKVL